MRRSCVLRRRALPPCALVAALAFASSCSEELPPPEPDRPTIDERTFTATLSDLTVARVQLLPDTAAYARRAEQILGERGVSEEDLRTFVEVHGQNDDRMTRVYARVSARLDTLFPISQPGTEVPPTADLGAEPAIDELSPDSVAAAP
jgi:hypothetical protein